MKNRLQQVERLQQQLRQSAKLQQQQKIERDDVPINEKEKDELIKVIMSRNLFPTVERIHGFLPILSTLHIVFYPVSTNIHRNYYTVTRTYNINFICSSQHVMFFLLHRYKCFENKKK